MEGKEEALKLINKMHRIVKSMSGPTVDKVLHEKAIEVNSMLSMLYDLISNNSTPSTSKDNTLQVSQAKEDVRSYNVGQSDYSKHKIQPWDIWLEYNLNPWDADIIKRILRTKETDSRKLDYEKIIHIAKERIRQLDLGYK